MSELRHGRIVWVELLDPHGRNPKVRPAVVLTATDAIRPDGAIQVAAITGETTAAAAEECVALPWLGTGHPVTKLTKPSVAVTSWLARVSVADVRGVGGTVPIPKMLDIVRKVVLREAASGTPPPPPAAPESS